MAATVSQTYVKAIAVDQIDPNPDQPRQHFDAVAIAELWDSIAAQGLIQPITVIAKAGGRYMIVAGERRWRAHVHGGAATIKAMVRDLGEREVMLQAIIENAMRKDVSIVEEAVAYGRLVDMGMDKAAIAANLGVAPFRVEWRLSLLKLRPEYMGLARTGQLTSEQALELAKLEPAGQDRLFAMIRSGQCPSSLALKTACAAIREEGAQVDAFGDQGKPSEASRRLAQGFEARVRKLSAMLREATVENEVVAVRRIDPSRAGTLADLFAAIRGDVERIETALRGVAGPVSDQIGA